jgi:PAS domain S-box-containing protein
MPAFRPSKRLRLQFRILVALVSLAAAAIGIVTLAIDFHQRHTMVSLYEDKGRAIGHSLCAAASRELLSYNYVALQQLTQETVEQEGAQYVIVLDKEGKVAGYSDRPDWQGRALTDPTSHIAAGAMASLVQRVKSPALGRHAGLDIAVPVYVEGSPQKWGTVRVGIALDPMYARLVQMRLWGIGVGVGVLLLACVIALLLARHITRPLHRLVEATGELARGNFDVHIDLATGDEFEDLARKFEVMTQEIKTKQHQVEATNRDLADLNATLEDAVRKRTRDLLEAEEKYRILVENSPNPICILQNRRLVFLNQAFGHAFGYSAEELQSPGFDFLSLLDSAGQRTVEALLAESDTSAYAATSTEITATHRDGTPITLDMRSTAISYEGAPALEAILVDITERRKLQDQVVAYERLRALGEMAGGVAHDFNNVLGVILARAQMLQRSADATTLRGLQIIEKAARDGAETVKRIQNFTRVRTEQDFTRLSLNPILEDVVEMTRSRWEDDAHRQGKKIQLVRELGQVPAIRGNTSELREVFTNLLLNAVDAIQGEGCITVRTWPEDSRVIVTVRDTGEGMTPEVRRRLFDPFFTTKGTQGTGLGMSVAYGIARRHGADVTVESEVGQGTLFRLSFPALQGGEHLREVREHTTQPVQGTERVLVVDDQVEILNLLDDVLRGAGYVVAKANGGDEALARLRTERFDLVITDLGMPGMSGWELSRETRKLRPEMRILLLTGWAATLDPEEIERNGVNATLKKPFEMNELLHMIRDVLGSPGTRRAA